MRLSEASAYAPFVAFRCEADGWAREGEDRDEGSGVGLRKVCKREFRSDKGSLVLTIAEPQSLDTRTSLVLQRGFEEACLTVAAQPAESLCLKGLRPCRVRMNVGEASHYGENECEGVERERGCCGSEGSSPKHFRKSEKAGGMGSSSATNRE